MKKPEWCFLQADSAQAEARVVFLLANDEQALEDIEKHDYHALTASWFFGGTENDYSKKVLGWEHPIRFAGKTLRHAGHLGAGKRRAAVSVNTDARKYHVYADPINKVTFQIDESVADRALQIFHFKQPKIRQVFHNGIVNCLKINRRLIAPVPYGVKSLVGGMRTFYERWGDELNRQAFSYIPQRTVSDNTKAAGIRLRSIFPSLRIIVEAHDALLFCIRVRDLNKIAPVVKKEFERPINFNNCSLPRRQLKIPCDIEIGYNYQEFSKFKMVTPDTVKVDDIKMPPMSITEQFSERIITPDTDLDSLIYKHMMEKREI